MPNYPEYLLEPMARLVSEIPGARVGKAFGHPGYFIGKRMFACLFAGGVGVKLNETLVKELVSSGKATPFVAYGKTMREWAILPGVDPSLLKRAAETAT